MTDTQLAYIAGFIDGEGCFTVGKLYPQRKYPSFYVTFQINNTRKEVLELIQEEFGGTIHFVKDTGRNKDQWHLSIHRTGIHKLIDAVMPYLILKKSVAACVREFPTRHGVSLGIGKGQTVDFDTFERQNAIYNTIRSLNKKGK